MTPSPTLRFVVCGPPGAGKTRWVTERARPGDVVWDLDAVATVVAQLPAFPRPRAIAGILLAMRDALVVAVDRARDLRVFVIVEDRQEAQRIASALHASLVQINAEHVATTSLPAPRFRPHASKGWEPVIA